MQIRTATSADLAAVVQIESECFPAAEAATELSLARRLALYPNHFWVLMDGKQLVGFVNGMATDEPDLRDEMYYVIAEARRQGRKGLVLTCKDRLVHYYAKFGFVSEGISGSTHGDVTWYQMRLTF